MPKPPASVEPRLAINPSHAASQAAPGAPQRVIPIRNLTAPPPKKKSPLVKYGTMAAVLVALGVGGYFGYGYINGMQDKVNAASKEAAKNADGGQVGHIANLYKTLDATDPARVAAGGQTAGPRQRRSGVGQEIPVAAVGGTDASAAASPTPAADGQPVIPAVWTLDAVKAKIPDGRANGMLSGTNFLPETARVDPVGTAHILRLLQGQAASPDREVLIYLHLKPGEKLGGQNLNISQDTTGAGLPQVTKRWKKDPRFAPQYKSFGSGYALRLELGQVAGGVVPGKIFLALPDLDQSVVAGSFTATITTNVVVETAVQIAPVMNPQQPSQAAADAAFQARYGTRR